MNVFVAGCFAATVVAAGAAHALPFNEVTTEATNAGRTARAKAALAKVDVQRDIVVAETPEKKLLLDVYTPREKTDNPRPCVVWIHGGGLDSLSKDYELIQWCAAHTAAQGFVSVSIDYRLIPEAPLPAAIMDCKTALRFVRAHAADYGIDPDRIAVAGESSGAYLAAYVAFADDKDFPSKHWAGVDSRVACAVLWYGHTLPDFNPLDHIGPGDPPTLLIHGNRDSIVPISESHDYLEKLTAAGVPASLHVIANGEHGFFDANADHEAAGRHMEEALWSTSAWLRRQMGMASERRMQPLAFERLPTTAIRPEGWLRNQLQRQAESLSGKLDEVWPDVRDSRWFGGDGRDGWERGPYWLDGVIPLVYLLEDDALIEKVERHIGYVLDHQGEDGWIGPRDAGTTNSEAMGQYDLWATFLGLKMLVEYHEATGDARVEGAVDRCLHYLSKHLEAHPLHGWGKYRSFEGLIAIQWLYERKPDPWLLSLAETIRNQGFDWAAYFKDWPQTQPTEKGKWNFEGHVVNNAMAVKAPALWWRLDGAPAQRTAAAGMMAQLDQYHGMVTGVFTGDECIAGKSPIQGTELCAVVEYMWSLEMLTRILGDPAFGDRLEKIAYNALPATFSPDMWSHQYDQQANQVECSVKEGRSWNTNGPDANTFGLEPNFGCCTANLSQGWPKFAAQCWMATPDGGLAAVAYAPSKVTTTIRGAEAQITLATDYPFKEHLRFTVKTDKAVSFPLHLRIPGWCGAPELRVDGEAIEGVKPGSYHVVAREWPGNSVVELVLPMHARGERRYNNALSITRGPLVYSLRVGEDWRRINVDRPGRELPHADWEVYPTTPWNYALDLSESQLEGLQFEEMPVGGIPFSPEGAPLRVEVPARRLPAWTLADGSADQAPASPVESSEALETVTLVPYGCTNLRITEFPTLAE